MFWDDCMEHARFHFTSLLVEIFINCWLSFISDEFQSWLHLLWWWWQSGALLLDSYKVVVLIVGLGPFRAECACSMSAWVLFRFPSFLVQSHNMHVRHIGDSIFPTSVSESEWLFVVLCGPTMNWKLVWCVTLPSLYDNSNRLQLTPTTASAGQSG